MIEEKNYKRKIFGKRKIRAKLLLFFFVVGIFPLIIVGLLSTFLIDLTRRTDVADLEQELIRSKTEEIESFIGDAVGLFELRVAYEQRIEPALEDQKFILDGMLFSNRNLKEVSFINLQGLETSRKIRGQKEEAGLRDLAETKNFQTAKLDKNYFGEVSYKTEGPEISLSAPVKNQNGEIIAVLSGILDLSSIQKRVTSARLGNSGYLYLVDKEGKVLAHALKPETIETNLSHFPMVSSVLAGTVRTGRSDSDCYKSHWNEKVIGAGGLIRNVGWAVIVEWPEQDALLPIIDLQRQVVQISFIVFLIVVGFAIFVASGISGPINILKKGAEEIRGGKFDYRISVKTGDELEELGAAFNKMAKGLKRLHELKNEFVFIASHELRTPVTVIRGYLSMILEGDAGPVSPKIKEFLWPISKSSEGLNKLIEDLLQVARSEAGRIEITARPCDVTEQVKTVLGELKILADEKSIKMIYEPKPDLPKILADPDKLREVIKNLVDNGIKYTLKPGNITVWHEIKEKTLLTHIKDDGVGISKENQKKLFQKFYRVKAEGTERIQGTGLGLWIIKQLVERMNGKIWAESEEGKGSTFTFSLPIA